MRPGSTLSTRTAEAAELLTQERLRELVVYQPQTGHFFWLCRRGGLAQDGAPAGWKNSNGYTRITVSGKSYYAHRLAWLYMTGEWPAEEVDHINGDRRDNRFANLRATTVSLNRANTKRRSDNTSGYKGVCWDRNRKRWLVRAAGKHVGYFDTPEAGHAAYVTAAVGAYGEFARTA